MDTFQICVAKTKNLFPTKIRTFSSFLVVVTEAVFLQVAFAWTQQTAPFVPSWWSIRRRCGPTGKQVRFPGPHLATKQTKQRSWSNTHNNHIKLSK